MNLVEQNELFIQVYLADTSDVHKAINQWVHDAETLCARYQNRISKSEALTACLTGQVPENLNKRKVVKIVDSQYVDRYIREATSDIDDRLVRLAVVQSLNKSKVEKKLIYQYNDLLSPAQRARVRVLCNMIWYNLYPKEGR